MLLLNALFIIIKIARYLAGYAAIKRHKIARYLADIL